MLMLIFGCDNKWLTISSRSLAAAKINGVLLNDWFQFQKWLAIKIPSKILDLNVMNTFELKCLWCWYQYLVVIIND